MSVLLETQQMGFSNFDTFCKPSIDTIIFETKCADMRLKGNWIL